MRMTLVGMGGWSGFPRVMKISALLWRAAHQARATDEALGTALDAVAILIAKSGGFNYGRVQLRAGSITGGFNYGRVQLRTVDQGKAELSITQEEADDLMRDARA
jgi:hypothetical protein